MNYKWLTLLVTPTLFTACSKVNPTISLESDVVSTAQIETIINNINTLYPNATTSLKQKAAETAVRSIEHLVFVQGGSFEMGDFRAPCEIPSRTRNRIDWSPDAACLSAFASPSTGAQHLHTVTLDSYSIAQYETAFLDMEWMRKINNLPMAANKREEGSPKIILGQTFERESNDYPKLLERRINKHARAKYWQEAKDYCLWLGKITALPFDLPTEAQWEYAARSRGEKRYFATNNGYLQYWGGQYYDHNSGYYIDYKEEEVNAGTGSESYLGQWPANPLGIYGMSNQISEWVNDWYSPDYYLQSPEHNPQGPTSGEQKVMRDASGITMTFARIPADPEQKFYFDTFRCALQQTEAAI